MLWTQCSKGCLSLPCHITCTDAGAATGANDPDACALIGYFRDGVLVFGLCTDELDATFTSYNNFVDGATTTKVATAGGTSTCDYEYSDADYAAGSCILNNGSGAVQSTTGQYSYFLTTGYPWVPTIYSGNSGSSNLCSAA